MGYIVSYDVFSASDFGVAQNRKRYFLVATKLRNFEIKDILNVNITSKRDFAWATADLLGGKKYDVFNTPAIHSKTNQQRIKYLFQKNIHELPDHMRPDCHKLKKHSYKSVYGRLFINEPTPTITTGFGSTGQGRFVHPTRQRTITPHEAARLQFFPDFFIFPSKKRRILQMLIGNAVPSKLPFLISLELLR